MARKKEQWRSKKKGSPKKSIIFSTSLFLTIIILTTIAIFNLGPKEEKHVNSVQKNYELYGTLLKGDTLSGTGTVMADLDCKGPSDSITCRAVIKMDKGSTVELKYTHDMTLQPCLSQGERVLLEPQGDNYKIKVKRIGESS